MSGRSGLLLPVPEAEPVVGDHRLRWDPPASRAVPAHVTLLFPFVPAAALDDGVERAVGEVLEGFGAFDLRLTRVERFPAGVLYLATEPAEPFRALTAALGRRFPQHPPYEGRFPDVVPHLTIADSLEAPLDEIERAVAPGLPVEAKAREVALMVEGDDGRWATRRCYPLAGA